MLAARSLSDGCDREKLLTAEDAETSRRGRGVDAREGNAGCFIDATQKRKPQNDILRRECQRVLRGRFSCYIWDASFYESAAVDYRDRVAGAGGGGRCGSGVDAGVGVGGDPSGGPGFGGEWFGGVIGAAAGGGAAGAGGSASAADGAAAGGERGHGGGAGAGARGRENRRSRTGSGFF